MWKLTSEGPRHRSLIFSLIALLVLLIYIGNFAVAEHQ
jgi:hypothetical protein